jgi:3',5'-cyclic AMP phosphodiesterase CpdA
VNPVQLGQYPAPLRVVAHLSDPHLLADTLQYGVIDTLANLRVMLDRVAACVPAPQALVFTGDLADLAEPAAYELLRSVVEAVAEALGAEVIWCMGNHDVREPFAAALFGESGDRPQDRVHDVDGLRIIALDSSVPGYHHGELTDDQLSWLRAELATPAELGTLLALHHPPIPVPMMRAAELIELHDQHRLAEVIADTDVRGILGGHFHFTSWSTFAGVPVSVASASCYTSDPAPIDRLISGVDAHQSGTMLHVYEDRIVHTVLPAYAGREVSGIDLDILPALESLSPAERHDLASRKDSPFYVQG